MGYIINSIDDLPNGEELFLGPSHQQFCNRYLRRGDVVEVQHIRRLSKSSPTKIMSAEEFNQWRRDINKQRGQ